MKVKVISLLFLFLSGSINAHTYWQDGGYHVINYDVGDWVMIDTYASPIPGTHLEAVSGGKLPLVGLCHYGELTVNGGIVNFINATQNSKVIIKNGFITMNGQYTNPGILINDESQVDIYGGLFETVEGSPTFRCTESSMLNILGGFFESNISFQSQHNSQITIYGTDFNYPYGKIIVPEGNTNLDITITGTLLDGNTINHSFNLYGLDSSIVLIPEPTTLGLMLFGTLAVGRKRRAKV